MNSIGKEKEDNLEEQIEEESGGYDPATTDDYQDNVSGQQIVDEILEDDPDYFD